MTYLIVFSAALAVVLTCGPTVKRLGFTWQLIDHPDPRKVHHQVMARSGGIAIALGTIIATAIGLLNRPSHVSLDNLMQFLAIALVALSFFGIGLADDRWSLSPKLRLGFQMSITVLAWAMGLQIHHLPIPGLHHVELGWLSLPVTFLWLAGITNAINWLDGLDGLASGVGIIAAFAFALLGWQQDNYVVMLFAIALGGAGVGFLYYNAMPAQMFMGDSGSYFIGGMLASLGISLTSAHSSLEQDLLPYFVLAVPIIDMSLVILTRLIDRKSPFFPDQRHLHHRLLRLNLTKQQTVFSIYGLSLWAGITAGLLISHFILAVTSLFGLTVMVLFLNRTVSDSTNSSVQLVSTPN
jgi:UDP-GlcNAc:undecaprenyl-phosphate/decaprenyl-phosphate GlcNAc-1-phosphate transferase